MENLCAFKLFGIGYFIYLILGIAIAVGLIFGLRKLNDRGRLIANISMISTVFLFILLEFIGRIIVVKDYSFFDNMPLGYFQIFAVLILIGLIRQQSKWIRFSYLIVLPVAFLSLIFMPKFYTEYSVVSLSLISYVLAHGTLIGMAMLNVLWEDLYLNKKDILDSMLTFAIISASLHILNVFLRFTFWGLHANYGGTMGEAYDLCIELLYFLIPVPFVHLFPIFAIMFGICFLLMIPMEILQRKKDKQGEIEELIALGNLKAQQEYRQKHAKKLTSQIYLKGETKATPVLSKDVKNKTTSDFVVKNKEIQVNKDTVEK